MCRTLIDIFSISFDTIFPRKGPLQGQSPKLPAVDRYTIYSIYYMIIEKESYLDKKIILMKAKMGFHHSSFIIQQYEMIDNNDDVAFNVVEFTKVSPIQQLCNHLTNVKFSLNVGR